MLCADIVESLTKKDMVTMSNSHNVRALVLSFIRGFSGEEKTTNDVFNFVQKSTVSAGWKRLPGSTYTQVSNTLSSFAELGYIKRVGYGRYQL